MTLKHKNPLNTMTKYLLFKNKCKLILIFTLLMSTFISTAQNSKEQLSNALNNTALNKRGVIKPDETDFRLDYDDVYETDTQANFLQEKGFHGGGPSWLGIIYGAFAICENDLISNTDSDVSVTGVSFWSSNKEDLEKISRIIDVIKSDEKILMEAIEIAKQLDVML